MLKSLELLLTTLYLILAVLLLKVITTILPGWQRESAQYHLGEAVAASLEIKEVDKGSSEYFDQCLYAARKMNYHLWMVIFPGLDWYF